MAVVSLGEREILLEDLVHANAGPSFDFLLGAFLVLLAHVHDGSCRGAIELLAVHALEVLRDLVGHAPMLALTSQALRLVRVGVVQLIAKRLIRGF